MRIVDCRLVRLPGLSLLPQRALVALRLGESPGLVRGLLPVAVVVLALSVGAHAQLAQGQPVVGCTNPPNTHCLTSVNAFTSALFLDASQFKPVGTSPPPDDICGRINAAIAQAAMTITPAYPVTIDARSFTGVQGNPN
jgi:hypothetical protein